MSKHTAGPWECVKRSHGAMLVRSEASGVNGYLAEIYSSRPSERDANARLIAAAPELLDALIQIADAGDQEQSMYLDPHIDMARAAIAKATGETK